MRTAPLLDGVEPDAAILASLVERARRIRSDCLQDPARRLLAARALLVAGDPPDSLLPIVRDGLRDTTRGDDPSALPAPTPCLLPEVLGPPSFPVRREAARMAAEMGPGARDLLPEVEACLRTRDPVLRALAAEASWRIAARPRVDELVAVVHETVPAPVRYFAPQGAPVAGPGAREALRVLAAMGPAARDADGPLRQLLAEPRGGHLRPEIEATLARLDPRR